MLPDDDLLAGAVFHPLWEGAGQVLEFWEEPDLVEEAFRCLHLQEFREHVPQLFEALDPQGEIHPPLGAKGVDQDRKARALDPLKEQGRTARLCDPVGDLGNLEHRIHGCRNPL